MITKLSVSNFKSIRQLDIDCKKVNIFIGEPNTGKSNILETLALVSWSNNPSNKLNDYVRFQIIQNLFYDGLLDHEIKISLSQFSGKPGINLFLRFTNNHFEFRINPTSNDTFVIDHLGEFASGVVYQQSGDIKFFRFKNLSNYPDSTPGGLKPPDGANLFAVVSESKDYRNIMMEFFEKYGLKLVARQTERTFELQKEEDGWISNIPYILASDTLRRIIFYTFAIVSNKNSTLVFEEPESNAFPYYTKYLGERIALDETNQFFIATHNPYLLSAIIEKSRKEDVQAFITSFKDFQTMVKPLTTNQLSELMEADPFFNIEHFIEEEE